MKNAKSIGYSTGPSGTHLTGLFSKWGIAEEIKPRIVQAKPGVPVGSLVATGEIGLGFQQLSELIHLKGVEILGPLPPGTQTITTVTATGGTGGSSSAGGAGGTVATAQMARATPDGYTVIIMSGSYATNAAMFKTSFDPANDILPMGLIGDTAFILVMHPGVGLKSVAELVSHLKAKPGSLNYASSGTGGIAHLSGELFDLLAGTKMTHIAYKGTGPAMNDVLGGQVQMIFGSAPSTVPLVKSNRLRALAVTTMKRMSSFPELPTIDEAGVKGYEVVLWYGVLGPKALPKHIVERWNSGIRKATKLPDMRERLLSEGFEIDDSPPSVFQALLKRDVAKWQKVVKDAKVPPIQ